jgi:hypothetical protein
MIVIPHDNDLKPGTWKGGVAQGEKQTALVCCPNGHIASLTDHDIKDDGAVSPSVVCPHEGCDFHEFIKLEGWKGEVKNA